MERRTFTVNQPFELESGLQLPAYQLAYTIQGNFDLLAKPVVWVCHAFSGSGEVNQWWADLFGPGRFFDPAHYTIICANMAGSCYGSTGPLSINPETSQPWFRDFPTLTNRDMVHMFEQLRAFLKIDQIDILIGGSMGGQHVLEWAIMYPERIKQLIPIATNAWHSPWGIAFNETQRMALEADPSFGMANPNGGKQGMATARAIAMLSYRSSEGYHVRQQEGSIQKVDDYKASSYQRYQGKKFQERFNAYSYWYLSKAMDSHQVGRGRGSAAEALRLIQGKALVIGIRSDLLFPFEEQVYLAQHIPQAYLVGIDSQFGHDGFLVETEALIEAFRTFLYQPAEQ